MKLELSHIHVGVVIAFLAASATADSTSCCSWQGNACEQPLLYWCHESEASCTGSCSGTWIPADDFKAATIPSTPTLPTACCRLLHLGGSQCAEPADNFYNWCNLSVSNCFDCHGQWIFPEAMANTASPTTSPTGTLTEAPTAFPTKSPTGSPTSAPITPTSAPITPTSAPVAPTSAPPTDDPTASPTTSPTFLPSSSPTASPTSSPTAAPIAPTAGPTASPTSSAPTLSPTATPTTASPTKVPTVPPTVTPTWTDSPTAKPTAFSESQSFVVASPAPNTCVCKDSWTYDTPGCRSTVNGCPDEPCDGWDEGIWCVVTDGECDTAVDGRDGFWSFCTPAPPPSDVANKQADDSSQNECECKGEWTAKEDGCTNTQNGCPDAACDGPGLWQSWCMVTDPNCATSRWYEDGYWSYCGESGEDGIEADSVGNNANHIRNNYRY